MAEQVWVGSLTHKLRLVENSILEGLKLPDRKDHKEGLKENDRFPEARVDVVVVDIDFIPDTIWIRAGTPDQIAGSSLEVALQVFHHFLEGAHLIKEL
jgi:hypothetical protein